MNKANISTLFIHSWHINTNFKNILCFRIARLCFSLSFLCSFFMLFYPTLRYSYNVHGNWAYIFTVFTSTVPLIGIIPILPIKKLSHWGGGEWHGLESNRNLWQSMDLNPGLQSTRLVALSVFNFIIFICLSLTRIMEILVFKKKLSLGDDLKDY